MDDPAWASTSSPFIVVSWPGSTTQKPARTPGTGGGRGSRDHSGQRDARERHLDARERHMTPGNVTSGMTTIAVSSSRHHAGSAPPSDTRLAL